MKQTAVDWLADNLHYLHSTKWDDILEQAKEIEKQQIMNAVEWDYKPNMGKVYYESMYGGEDESI